MAKQKLSKKSVIVIVCVIVAIVVAALGVLLTKNFKKTNNEETKVQEEQVKMPESMKTKKITPATEFAGGSGTKADPYQIATVEQLALLSAKSKELSPYDYTNAYYVLTNDIVVNDVSNYDNWDKKAPQYGWMPIDSFNGIFDGAGHKVIGMFICSDDYSNSGNLMLGLFKNIFPKAQIKNINIDKCYIKTYVTSTLLGAIAGDSFNGEITNCTVNGKIIGFKGSTVGGVVGHATNTKISKCTNSSDVTGVTGCIGGISGSYSGYYMVDCINNGKIVGDGFSDVGGISGMINDDACASKKAEINPDNKLNKNYVRHEKVIIKNLVNNGNVKLLDTGKVGAISALLSSSRTKMYVSEIKNTGAVEFTGTIPTEVGGLFAKVTSLGDGYGGSPDIPDNSNSALYISKCENLGKITSAKYNYRLYVGGIVGAVLPCGKSSMSFSECINKSETSNINAGIVANVIVADGSKLSFDKCENYGDVDSGHTRAGGIIASLSFMEDTVHPLVPKMKITNCINYASVSSTYRSAKVGGIVGYMDCTHKEKVAYIENSINKGAINAGKEAYVGGIIGNLLCKKGIAVAEVTNNINEGSVGATGTVKTDKALKHAFVGGIAGVVNGKNEFNNNKFTSTIVIDGDKEGAITSKDIAIVVE